MSDRPSPATNPSEKPVLQPEQSPVQEELTTVSRGETLSERMFAGMQGVHAIWRLLIYLMCVFFTGWFALWLGTSLFSEPVRGPAVLWREMYVQAALVLAATLPALLMARLEGGNADFYGLPRRQAFGRMFWVGTGSGLAAITILIWARGAARSSDLEVRSFLGHLLRAGRAV